MKPQMVGLLFFAVLCLGTVSPLRSAAAAAPPLPRSGTIVGRVQDGETGRYLNNARVSVNGTAFSTFTDQTGTYWLANVPPGPVLLDAFFTGLEPQQARLTLAPAQRLEHDFQLGSSGAVVRMEKFLVRGAKDLETIAANEQRFAPNIKLVAAPGVGFAYPEGNVGELLKSLPGVTPEYWDDEIMAISVRGFSANLVGMTVDGAAFAAASHGSHRDIQTPNLSLNNVSRLEVTHVPTPSTPADSLGGAINLISKSAFERATAEFRYSVFLSANSHAMTLAKAPDKQADREIARILPGFTFDYTLPVTRNFGVVLSANRSEIYGQNNYFPTSIYMTEAVGTGASLRSPYLRQASGGSNPRITTRTGGSLKADWRIGPNLVFSVGVKATDYDSPWSSGSWGVDAGTIGLPVSAGGVGLTFGPDFTHGASGRGQLRLTSGLGNRRNWSMGETARFRFDNGTWRIEGGVTRSNAKVRANEAKQAHFSSLSVLAANPVRVNLDDVPPGGFPAAIQVFNNNNELVDLSVVQSYRLATASLFPRNTDNAVRGADASMRRRIDRLSYPITVQVGATENRRTNDTRYRNDTYSYDGPPGLPAALLNIVANRPLGGAMPAVFDNIPWPSAEKAYAAWRQNPSLFKQTPAQSVASERSLITSSEWIQETSDAAYLQLEGRFFRNRLGIVTGVRWEQTRDVGCGPLVDPGAVYLRNAVGAYVHDAQGRQIRRPEAGAPGSMEELRFTSQERAFRGQRTYDGYFPSFNAVCHVTDNFLIRLGWAQTYGRPDWYLIIPNTTIRQANLDQLEFLDPSQVRGRIDVRNIALRPWSANNYDLTGEYYWDQGGLATVSLFTKNIRDFFGNLQKPATTEDLATLGLDSSYLGWLLSTQTNTDRARVSGVALNLNQSLRALGSLGRYFSVFGNITQLQLRGEREADFYDFIESTSNWGFEFSRHNLNVSVSWNHLGWQRWPNVLVGDDGYDYAAANTFVDANLGYRLGKYVTVFANARNLFNQPRIDLSYGSETPHYARQTGRREYGTRYTAGIRGTF